jgi:dienelactone hydrolase
MAVMAQETDVAFAGSGGAPIAGTLCLPAAAADDRRVPAFLLVQGSGPTDRDGNQPPGHVTDLMRQVAALLAGFGIASLRCDKRGQHANAESLPRDLPSLTEFVRWEHAVADAAAGLALLRARVEIDPARVGLFGHSEGGLIGLELGAGGEGAPAALVLAATPGRPIGAVLRDQLHRLGRRQGGSEEVLAPLLDAGDRILAHVVATGDYPPDIPPNLAALFPAYLRRFWQSLAARDPAAFARRVTGPVLAVGGSEDVQVLAGKDVPALDAALGSRPAEASHRVVMLAGAGHALKASPDNVAGPLHPDFGPALASWLTAVVWRGE